MSIISPDAGAVVHEAHPMEEEAAPTKRKGLGFLGWFSIGWLTLLVLAGAFANFLPLDDPTEEVTTPKLAPMQGGHWLGADANGRDMLARVVFGARTSLIIAVCAIGVGLIFGGTLGLLAGYFRNWVGNILTSFFDILLAIPQLVLALSLVSVLKGDPSSDEGSHLSIVVILVLALGLVSIPLLARITRASTLSWSQREFVMAARAQGASHARILWREILPNVAPAIMSIALLGVAIAVVAEGGLAILGASVEPPQATLGSLVATGKPDLTEAPFLVWIPVFAIFLTAAALNYLGDLVRDRFDVRESAL